MSASRPILTPFTVINGGDMTTTLVSIPTIIQNMSMLSYSCAWTGSSPIGTVTVEVSNDYAQNADGSVRVAGTWNTLPMSATGSVSGNTGNGFADIDAQAGYALRLRYTPASGSGSLTVVATGKVS